AEWTEVPFDRRVGRVIGELEGAIVGAEIVRVPCRRRITQWYERASFVVGDDVAAVADGVDAEQRHAPRRSVGFARGLSQPPHLDRRRQRLADPHWSVE